MGVRISEIQANRFLFEFPHELEARRVLDEGPWSFENHALLCKSLGPGMVPTDVTLDTIEMWVQAHNIPYGYTSEAVMEQIGNYLGSFVKTDSRNFGGIWHPFYRIRVKLEVKKPLKRRMKFSMRDKAWVWVKFQYERLHSFCYCCGIMGHTDRFCAKALASQIPHEQYKYGPELRAVGRRKSSTGLNWLLADDEDSKKVTQEEDGLLVDPKVGEKLGGIVATPKRRRGDAGLHENESSTDIPMKDISKNGLPAGSGFQTRPKQ